MRRFFIVGLLLFVGSMSSYNSLTAAASECPDRSGFKDLLLTQTYPHQVFVYSARGVSVLALGAGASRSGTAVTGYYAPDISDDQTRLAVVVCEGVLIDELRRAQDVDHCAVQTIVV